MKRTSKSISVATPARLVRLLGMAALIGTGSSAFAAGSLDNISFSAGPGGRVDITLSLSEPAKIRLLMAMATNGVPGLHLSFQLGHTEVVSAFAALANAPR